MAADPLTMTQSVSRVLLEQFGQEGGEMARGSLWNLGHQPLSLVSPSQSVRVVGLWLWAVSIQGDANLAVLAR